MTHSAFARWSGIFTFVVFASLLSTSASALSLVLTDGTAQRTCETIGQVVIQGSTLQAQVADGCLGAPSEGTPTGPYTLTVSKNGPGTVSSNPAGISCGSSCSGSFESGTSVTLSAAAASGYTFGSWSGCASTSGTSCTVSMGGNRNVTASFTSSTSTTGDPGTGLWNPTAKTFVFDRTRNGSDTHVPGCIPNEYTNCQWGGSQSTYVSIKAGEVWSMRVPFKSHEAAYLRMPLSLAEAGANLSLSVFDVAITKAPGDFDSADRNCKRDAITQHSFTFKDAVNGAQLWGGCPLDQNTVYYYNVRPAVGTAAATQCGANSSSHCRVRIANMFPSGAFSY